MPKITIVGAGNVGATAALFCAARSLGDVVITDIVEGLPQGKALDIQQALPISNTNAKVTGTNNYEDTANSDVVVITAGLPRKEGMTREDLIEINGKIISSITKEIVKHSPNTIIIVVTNPVDSMTYIAAEVSNFPKSKVLGMAGCLDSARLRAFLAQELNTPVDKVGAMTIGFHGEHMVPVASTAKVNGQKVTELLSEEKLNEIIERTRNAGAEFLPLLKTSAWVAPGRSIAEMVEAIVKDEKKTLSAPAWISGEYGYENLYVGVPIILGKDGVEKILEIELSDKEKQEFANAVAHAKTLMEQVKGKY
jgi:malate dehydrogenase